MFITLAFSLYNTYFNTVIKLHIYKLLMAILEAQMERRSPATRTEKSWQIDRKLIKPK